MEVLYKTNQFINKIAYLNFKINKIKKTKLIK